MRHTAYLALSAVLMLSSSCAGFGKKSKKTIPKAAAAEPVEVAPPPAPPLSPEEFATWYQTCWGHFNERRWDEFTQCYAENAESVEPGNGTMNGRDAVLEQGAKHFANVFDGKGEVQLTLINGKELLAVALFNGKQIAPLATPSGEVPASNKPIGYFAVHRIQLDDQNKVQKQWMVFDTNTLLSQIGASKVKARKAIKTGWKEKVTAVSTNDATEAANLAAAQKMFELFGAHDPTFAGYLHRNVVSTDVTLPADLTGKPALQQQAKTLWTGFSDARVETEAAWAAGAYTVLIGRLKGTNDGNFPPLKLKKTGKPLDVALIEIVEWKDGKAVRVMPFVNGLEMATGLGLVAAPAPAAPPAEPAAAPAEEPQPSADATN